ncbi:FmdB family zinc ribbon protein [Alkalispirochaeta sphaeroplastigenens]|uniref:FmdB family zinc ribbon protein n=1 Tax=Alkalispirochaeta sphaeroplastigenens TaxID=1187066 RepID=UPI000CDA82C5|nr:zinc ribbon domain-containing protein [Alkalispirochaeta sphaeroplastigenens]
MPNYDYQCRSCGHTFETFQSMSADALVDCPSCEKPELRRLITGGTGVIFKGSGFYVTDSKSKSSGAGSATGSTASTSRSSDSSSSPSETTGKSEKKAEQSAAT